MKAIHYTEKHLINPTHPVTVNLIGCGGTGSQVLSSLARMNEALIKLGHAGFHVRVFDEDIVTEANIGRQMFSPSDIGKSKSTVLVSRVNRFFGLNWESHPMRYGAENFDAKSKELGANIIITCVDTAKSRIEISQLQKAYIVFHSKQNINPFSIPYYWLDFGNSKDTGQVVLGTLKEIKQPKSKDETVSVLKTVVEMFPNLSESDEKDNTPSCSLAEAINRQDLFINSTVTQFGMNILWKLFREARLKVQGAFINVNTLCTNPIIINAT